MKKMMIALCAIGLMMIFSLSLTAQEGSQPRTPRNYMLVFDMIEYSPKVEEAVLAFFNNVFLQGDQLIVVTPAKSMGFSPQKLAQPKEKLSSDLITTLKLDIQSGASRYRSTLQTMTSIVNSLLSSGSADLTTYTQCRKDLVTWRGSLSDNLQKYAKIFSAVKGDNHLLLFMQEELRPVPNSAALNKVLENSRNPEAAREMLFATLKAFNDEIPNKPFDLKKVTTTFRFARIRFHFLYFNLPTGRMGANINTVDNLGDLQSDLKKLAQATNGVVLNSSQPADFLNQVRSMIYDGKVETEVVSETMEKE